MASGAACGQIGCNCGAFAPYFFGFSLFLLVEVVFKGVQIVHIMLSLDPKGDRKGRPYHRRTGDRWHLSALPIIAVYGGTTHRGEGGKSLCSYVFFPSSEKWLTPIIARTGEYTQAGAYLQEGLDLAFTGGLHPGENRFGVLDVALVGQVFGVNAGRLPRGCRCDLRGGR
jgi:hypothetical protein